MAYRIEYSGAAQKISETKHTWKENCVMVILLLGILSSALFPIVRRVWLQILVPGDDTSTKAAVSTMLNEIRQGNCLDEAFFAFCEEILDESV